jgi:sugar phosphate isomerase/epimerase
MSRPQISVQLYSVRQTLDADLDGTIGKLAEIGLTAVEAFDFVDRPDQLKAALDRYGLRSPTGHANLMEQSDLVCAADGGLPVPSLADTFAAAAALGVKLLIHPFLPRERWVTRADVQRNAERLNEVADQAAAHGLTVGYHNHEHELASVVDGLPALELFADMLDPLVRLEVDLYWAAVSGLDPAALLGRLGDRVVAVHVKDGPLRPGITSHRLPEDQLVAGRGDVPLAEALTVARAAEYAVIEFDHYAGDVFAGIGQSFEYLTAMFGK